MKAYNIVCYDSAHSTILERICVCKYEMMSLKSELWSGDTDIDWRSLRQNKIKQKKWKSFNIQQNF